MSRAFKSTPTVSVANPNQQTDLTITSHKRAWNLKMFTPHRFTLRFPSHWRSPYPQGNIYLEAFEHYTLDWLSRFGLVKDQHDRETLRKFSCGRYSGYSSPRATFRDGLLMTQFESLWLYWDDRVVEDGTAWCIDDVLAAMEKEDRPSGSDGFLSAWNDVCVRLRRTQGARWMCRLSADMEAWMKNAKHETAIAQTYKVSGTLPDFEALIKIRTVSIGMYPTFYLIEMTEGLELSESFHQHSLVKEMKGVASRLVGFGNDLGGLAKDLADGWPNLVVAMQKEKNVPLQDAFGRIVDMHNADITAFDNLEKQLPSWGREMDLQIQGWVQAVRHGVVGFILWESVAERYQTRKVLVGNKVLSAPVAFVDT